MSILFITHNLGVVAEIVHEVAVMYAGRWSSKGRCSTFSSVRAIPIRAACSPASRMRRDHTEGGGRRLLNAIPGNVPSALDLPWAAPLPRVARWLWTAVVSCHRLSPCPKITYRGAGGTTTYDQRDFT